MYSVPRYSGIYIASSWYMDRQNAQGWAVQKTEAEAEAEREADKTACKSRMDHDAGNDIEGPSGW